MPIKANWKVAMKWERFVWCIRSRNLMGCIAVIAVFSTLYCRLTIHQGRKAESSQNIGSNELSLSGEMQRCKQQWSDSTTEIDTSHPLNIPYLYLAGSCPNSKKYLSIGIPSVKRTRGSYLLDTIQSIFEKSSFGELQQLVVVIYLAEFDVSWSTKTTMEIKARFGSYINVGHLLIIQCPMNIYPTMEHLKVNYNDPQERVQFRTKQNADFAFLVNFCSSLSDYYLMLEDDVLVAKHFLTFIKRSVTSIKRSVTSRNLSWTTLSFSKLGYIGKLHHSADLPKLARFLLMFYDEMPYDRLLELFHKVKAQHNEIRFKPSLFQHMGTYSSLKGSINQRKDNDFQERLPDNPPASVYTDIQVYKTYQPSQAYKIGPGQFWGISPVKGNSFLIVFEQPARVAKVCIRTGSFQYQGDILLSGVLQVGRDKIQTMDHANCKSYSLLGKFSAGIFEMDNLMVHISEPVDCVRVLVTEDQSNWLIISEVNIWIEEGESTP